MAPLPSEPRSADEIRQWIVERICEQTQLDAAEIGTDQPLISHGVDSMQFVVIVGELEDWLGCRFVSNPIVRYPTINGLSEFLARQSAEGKTVVDPAAD